jgi:hypothetical protein
MQGCLLSGAFWLVKIRKAGALEKHVIGLDLHYSKLVRFLNKSEQSEHVYISILNTKLYSSNKVELILKPVNENFTT